MSEVRNKGGAPRGNRNALRTGCHTAEMRAFRREISLFLRRARVNLAFAKAWLAAERQRPIKFDSRGGAEFAEEKKRSRRASRANTQRPQAPPQSIAGTPRPPRLRVQIRTYPVARILKSTVPGVRRSASLCGRPEHRRSLGTRAHLAMQRGFSSARSPPRLPSAHILL
jgi:hypothetical protein